jgi:hypothetical protein
MAINVNTVYQTVLLILNKEQRGYMTPVEFNKIGQQVQLEIFEKYFEDINQQIRVPQTNVDYANRVRGLDEKISIFKTSQASVYNAGATPPYFALPVGTTQTLTSQFISTGANSYSIPQTTSNQTVTDPTVTVNGTALATGFSFNNNLLTFTVAATPPASLVNVPTDGPSIGVGLFQFTVANNATNLTIPIGCKVTGANTAGAPVITDRTVGIGSISFTLNIAQNYVTGALLNFTNDIVVTGKWTTVGETPVYRLGTVTFTNGALSSHQLQRVTRSELYHLLGSNLTKPTQAFPIYIYEDEKLFVYPTTINSGINADYIKKPAAPSWNFTVGTQNQYIYDTNTSINFEIHQSEQTELILKILLYAGVVIKDPQIIQVAAAQVAQDNQNQKS